MASKNTNAGFVLGARASNAGDNFHELWALRAALSLLTPGTLLTAVSVEGVPTDEPGEFRYDGVDCGFFYGGATLETSTQIVLQQLKYSTTDPDAAWTIARLTHSKAKKVDNSVIRRLADSYKEAASKKSHAATLTMKLVSNQPLAAEVEKAIAKYKAGDVTDADAVKLIAATGLSGNAVSGFLDALDFSDMRSPSRRNLQDEVTRLTADLLNDQVEVEVLALQGRIGKLMLPESQREFINLQTVLSWFGINSTAAIFPAPADLKAVVDPIERQAANELRDALIAGHRLVCLHGRGGCGKTTTVMQVTDLLPPGSVSVVFDCYGAGSYSHTNDRRHLPERAFLQMSNDLAAKLGLPMLLAHSRRNPADVRVFLDRVTRAANDLAQIEPQAILSILIDAADNSVTAAERETPSECFVWDVAGAELAKLPPNVRIVMSSRTGRKDRLRLPAGTPQILCPPFSLDETRAYVTQKVNAFSEDWLSQFQALSEGVPRVQTAAFTKGGSSLHDVLEALQPGKTLENVFSDLFQEAAKKSGDPKFYVRCVTTLSIMPPPIPLRHLAAICASNEATIVDFVSDVQPSLRISGDTIRIADEDVEDFLRDAAAPDQAVLLGEICDYFNTIYTTDEYAATHYCELLARAGRASRILPILERDRMLGSISDPVARREVQLRRLRLAMQACRSANSTSDTIKVILLSAEAAKDEVALQELLKREAELSVRFAAGSLFRLVLADRDQYPQQGPILVHDAARAAQEGDLVTARERVRAYSHWMRERDKPRKDGQQAWKMDAEDVTALAEARAILEGPSFAGVMWGWPRHWAAHVGLLVAPKLIVTGRRKVLEKAYEAQHLPKFANLFLTVPLALIGYPISTERLQAELASLRRKTVPNLRRSDSLGGGNWTLDYLELLVTACEIAYSRKVTDAAVLHALELILAFREQPSTIITRGEALKIDVAARAWLLRQYICNADAKSQDFIEWASNNNPAPEKKKLGRKKKKLDARRYDRDDELSRNVNAVFSTYVYRLDILKERRNGPLAGQPVAVKKAEGADSYFLDSDYYPNQFRSRAGQSMARLMHIDGISTDWLLDAAESISKSSSDGAFANRSFPIWQEFLIRPELHAKVLARITARSRELMVLRTAATDKANKLLEFAKAVLPVSDLDAQAIFQDAVKIAQEIDREATIQIEFVAGLATRHGDIREDLRRSLATIFSGFVTDVAIRLEGEERFPWIKATQAIYDFSPEIGLAAVSQWQDEGLAELGDTFRAVLKRMAAKPEQLVEACIFTGLLKYATEGLVETLAKAAKSAPKDISDRAFELLARKCLLDAEPGHRELLAAQILRQLPKRKMASPYLDRLRLEHDLPVRRRSDDVPDEDVDEKPLIFPPGTNFLTGKGMDEAAREVHSRQRPPYYSRQGIYIAMRKTIVSPAQKVPFLRALGSFSDSAYDADARAIAILDALKAWKGQLAVDNWRTNELPAVIATSLPAFASYFRETPSNLPTLIEQAELKGDALIDLVASALEVQGGRFSSTAIFSICELLASALNSADASAIAKWYIERLGEKVPADTMQRYDVQKMPVGTDDALGRFLYCQLSDIDQRVRWRTAHVVRALATNGSGKYVQQLMKLYDITSDEAFRIREAPFYAMAAKLWTVMTVARIAIEAPSIVVPAVPKLISIATDEGFPHYLIRGHAKSAVESLIQAGHVTLNSGDAMALKHANLATQKPVKVRARFRGLDRFDQKGRGYRFDTLDTIPYWFTPLYRLLATMTPERFFDGMAEWVVTKWKVDPKAGWWDNEPRKKRLNERNGMLSHRGQAGLATLERYASHMEFHGMFCALGRWLNSEPFIEPEDHTDALEYWAKNWRPTEYPGWISDRRLPMPVDEEFHMSRKGQDAHWIRRVPKQVYLATILGGKGGQADALAIQGTWSVASVTRESHIDIDSALVEPASALALLRSLGKGDRQFGLPTECEHDDEVLDVAPFRLRGWLSYVSSDMELDSDDPLRKGISHLRMAPAGSILEKYSLQPVGVPVQAWKPIGPTEWFRHESWGDNEEREYPQKRRQIVGVNGSRIWLSKNALFQILDGEGLDLIVDVEIERRLENEYGETSDWNDKKRRHTTRQVFILRKSGDIEDESGRVGAWR